MKQLLSILILLVATSSAFAETITFSKDFIASRILSLDNEPGKTITIQPFETFSNTGYGHNGLNVFPTFYMVFVHPGFDFPGTYVNLEPQQLKIIWEGPCEYGAKHFRGEMVSFEQLRVVLNVKNGKVSIHGMGTVVGECN